ncbi:hypothetical protein ACE38W_00430 [Chitinophaga sp. Hz27]|uniref:hypothetical protein n=1 Tax=Chitinophaga sp. Hz27 TaxID=3347169 RepID=UPI0035DDF702
MQNVILFTHSKTIVNNFVGWTLGNYAPGANLPLSTDHFFTLPAGQLLHAIAITPSSDIVLSIGSTPGAADIQPDIELKANESFLTMIGKFSAFSDLQIFFNGISQDALVKFFII